MTTSERRTADRVNERLEGMFERLLESDFEGWAPILMPDGSAPQRQWPAEDGWLIVYTTGRVDRGRWAGKFVVMAYRPEGKGSRTGKAEQWRRVYARPFSQRKAAKARALELYRQHSPKWAARNPEVGRGA